MLMWLDPEPTRGPFVRKGRGTLAEGEHLWLVPTARPSWGRVRYALGMDTQN